MKLTIKFKGKEIVLDEWRSVDTNGEMYERRSVHNNIIDFAIMLQLCPRYCSSTTFSWEPMFFGSLSMLQDIYHDCYPEPRIYYLPSQLKEAQKHADQFLIRIDSLTTFL